MCNLVNSSGSTPISSLSTSLPFPLSGKNWKKVFMPIDNEFDWLVDLSNRKNVAPTQEYGGLAVLRGIKEESNEPQKIQDHLDEFLDLFPCPPNCSRGIVSDLAFPLSTTFPQIFKNTEKILESVPIFSRLSTNVGIVSQIEKACLSINMLLDNIKSGGGDEWSSIGDGETHSSNSYMLRSFEEGLKGMMRDDFVNVRESLFELESKYSLE